MKTSLVDTLFNRSTNAGAGKNEVVSTAVVHRAAADCVERYHSTVFASPSSKLTLGA
jgi:hypothetical protein